MSVAAQVHSLPRPWADLVDLGFSLMPVELRGKRPIGPWKPFCQAPASTEMIAQWAARPSNIGVVTGAVSGLFVLDTDSAEATAEVERRGVPHTVTVSTAHGRHYYFRHPGGTIGNRAGILPGTDIRGDGGYVVAPGSVHPTGAKYEWLYPPGLFDLAPPPQWLLDLLAKPEPKAGVATSHGASSAYGERAIDNELSALRRASEGERNDALNRAAFNLAQLAAGGVIDQGSTKSHLRATAAAIGLDAAEIEATMDSGWTAGSEQPRRPEPRPDSRTEQFQSSGPWEPHNPETGEIEPDLLPVADLAAWGRTPAKPTEFLLPGLIPKNEWAKLDAIGGGTKSTFGLQLAICRAAGRPFLGVDLVPGITIYENAEDSFDRIHWLTEHICRAQGIDVASLQGRLHISSVRGQLGNELATFDHVGRLATTPAFAKLKATIRHTGSDFVILDNLAHLYAGNENDRGQVTAWINLLYSLNVTGLLLGHPNKAGDSYSGTTAWLNAMRAQLIIERLDELDPDALTLRVGKANYARPGKTLRYRWHDFALWLEEELPADTRAEIADTIRASGDNELFLRCLSLRNEQQRPVSESPASRTFAPRVFAEMAESKKIGVRRLEAAMERLFRIERIERGFVGRIDQKDKEGLREKCAEVRADPALTPRADVRSQSAPSALPHTLDTTYQSGAPHEAAAPDEVKGANG